METKVYNKLVRDNIPAIIEPLIFGVAFFL